MKEFFEKIQFVIYFCVDKVKGTSYIDFRDQLSKLNIFILHFRFGRTFYFDFKSAFEHLRVIDESTITSFYTHF